MLAAILAASLLISNDPSSYDCLRWRCIGPHRAGRTVGAAGIPDRPNTFFIGVNNGGVWKTTDAGRTWNPIFDDQPTGSIGAIAVAPSNQDILYVGTGEGLQRPDLSTGDGMFRSDDGGKTWRHIGLADAQQIGAVIVDPKNPDRVFAAVMGHPYAPSEQRGIFRTLDGGKNWERVLFKNNQTCAPTVAFDPTDSNVLYADLWQSQLGPWENSWWQGAASGMFKSTDGGTTWKQLTGLPTAAQGLGRIGFDVARSNPKRVYATVDAPEVGGIFRSDDAGETWMRVANEHRLWSRGSDFAEIRVHPRDENTVYIGDTSTYRSEDGGKTWTCIKGAPGGDDYHTIWINPLHPEYILLAADQGATISVNGGETWSSWYNQPTAQFYHVITDNQFPYWVYGGQQESGSVGISSRGSDGQVTFREWHPAGGDEYAYFAPDPLDPNLVYGGKVTRYRKDTNEVEAVGPDRQKLGLRFLRTAPLIFSPADPKSLYLGAQVLLRTRDGGGSWDVVSPDLSREKPEPPETIGSYRTPELAAMKRRGVIYTVAPSYLEANTIWCGTDDGLIHISTDGGSNWKDVTPPGLSPWSKVSIIDAGRFDAKTSYAAVNRIRLDDQSPHIYRTHDGGATWMEVVAGLPSGPVNAVREDTKRKGLLFCSTERAVFFSLDDGDHWQPLRLNMPATSVRDIVIHEDDLVAGTHGRSFWILDNISLLRQLPFSGEPALVPPPPAYQLTRNTNTDTPLPPEEPGGKNPPDGAMIDYWLPSGAAKVSLELVDSAGTLVRQFASDDSIPFVRPESLTVMPEWARPTQPLSAAAGSHRFIWDLRLPRPQEDARRIREAGPEDEEEDQTGSLPISAIWRDTPFHPLGAWVKPGQFTVRLTVDGKAIERPLDVRADPRKK